MSGLRVLLTPASQRAQAETVNPLRLAKVDVRVTPPANARGRLDLMRNMMTAFTAGCCASADVVLTDTVITLAAVAASRAARMRGRSFMLRPRGDWFQEAEDRARRGQVRATGSPRTQRLFRRCFRSATGIIPVSRTLGANLAARLDLDRERVIPVPIPTDIERFHPADDAEVSRLKAELGYEAPHVLPVVTHFQFAQKVAGVEQFLPALRALVDARADTMVVIAGDGPLHSEFLERNHDLLDHPRLLAPGFVNGIEELYRCASFIPYFSLLDGCPNVLLEAWASGQPVVLNDYAPLLENLREGETGFVLREADDIAGCLEIMNRLLDDGALRERMRKAARRVAEEQFAPEVIGARLAASIATLANNADAAGDD